MDLAVLFHNTLFNSGRLPPRASVQLSTSQTEAIREYGPIVSHSPPAFPSLRVSDGGRPGAGVSSPVAQHQGEDNGANGV